MSAPISFSVLGGGFRSEEGSLLTTEAGPMRGEFEDLRRRRLSGPESTAADTRYRWPAYSRY
jgi:hypothetical protein